MYKQTPSRANRSKGLKVKHVVQICLLVAVCFWLVYQVKHSQDKRREFDAKDENPVDKAQTQTDDRIFGRKDLPRVTGGEKHVEEEEDKEAEEEDNRHEEEELKPVEDEDKHEEEVSEGDETIEERAEGGGAGDDEIDENDLEKREDEQKQGEEQVEENNDREVNDTDIEQNHAENEDNEDAGKEGRSELEETQDVDREDQRGRESTSEDQDHGDSTDTHEAQEELYKADDASSEVAHNVQTFNSETENVTMGQANDMFGKVNFGQENETTSVKIDTLVKSEEQSLVDKDGVSNGTVIEQSVHENNLTKSDDGSVQNSTSAMFPSKQPEMNSNLTSLEVEQLALTNGTQSYDTNLSQNTTLSDTTGPKNPDLLGTVLEEDDKPRLSADENKLPEASAKSNKTENADTNAGESFSSNSTMVDSSQKNNLTDTTEVVKNNSVGDGNQDGKSDIDGATGSDDSSTSHSYDENPDGIQHDPIDASDTSVTEEEKRSRLDLDTLPEIKTEVQNTEEAMNE